MAAGKTARIVIVRRGGYADRFRSYKIFINDKEAGTIARNAVLNLDVPRGKFKVEARVDWCRSQPLSLKAIPGRTVEIEVSNYWGTFLALWGVTFGRDSYLLLRLLASPA